MVTHLRLVDSSTATLWIDLFPTVGYLVIFYIIITAFLCFIKVHIFNANRVDPDQTPRSAASDLGLHCLQITLLGVSKTNAFNTVC